MALIGALDKTKHFAEFNEPLFSNEGVLTPSQRKAKARTNLGVASGDALATVVGLTDSTTGTVGDTIGAITDPADTPADADALRDDLVTNAIADIRNDIASLTAKINEIIVAFGGTDPNA